MDVNHFEYPDLALTVDRGNVGQPSTVTIGGELVLICALSVNSAEECRELTVHSFSGDSDAVTEFRLWSTSHRSMTEVESTTMWVEDEYAADAALALGRAMLLPDLHNQFPRLLVKVIQ